MSMFRNKKISWIPFLSIATSKCISLVLEVLYSVIGGRTIFLVNRCQQNKLIVISFLLCHCDVGTIVFILYFQVQYWCQVSGTFPTYSPLPQSMLTTFRGLWQARLQQRHLHYQHTVVRWLHFPEVLPAILLKAEGSFQKKWQTYWYMKESCGILNPIDCMTTISK